MADKTIIDLDSLVPASLTIKLGDQEISVKPPTTQDIFRLGSLSSKLKDAGDMPEPEVLSLIAQVTEQIVKCIPELSGKELNTAQLLKLVQILSDMSIPADIKNLQERGIEPNDPKAS